MTFEQEMAESDAQVVARNGRFEWTRRELLDLFNRSADRGNWKNPINRVVTLANDRELLGLREAIVFFTGSVPTLTAIGTNRYRVRATGYYRTIGA